MSFSVGIVGLPNVGKSTLFKALTRQPVDIADYPFTTLHPNVGIVQVPDKRLQKIAEIVKPEKITPTIIEFIDIAGLVKGAHQGEGLGNQFLARIRECDAIVEVVKSFGESQNPEKDIETIKTELELKDLEIEERKLSSPPSAFAREVKEKENLLSKKPIIYLLNTELPFMEAKEKKRTLSSSPTDGKSRDLIPKENLLAMNLKDELEISELPDSDKKELGLESHLDQLILACYNTLDLITFFTITGQKETRAWTLKNGLRAPEAGGLIHSDFQEKFIRGEVIPWQKLVEIGSWKKARELGQLKTAGKDYIVQDGDVIEFKI